MTDRNDQGFGTFAGVFRPVTLTVLGAMLYLREGLLVGNNGLLGALLVILAATAITGLTSLSLASIATNVRVKPGGAFAIVAQALGLEAGGAVGIPLWFAQTLSTVMYVFAFSEAWTYVFPGHWSALIAALGFVVVAVLAWRSAVLAFRAQAVMLLVGLVAIASAFAGWSVSPVVEPTWIGTFETMSLRQSFSLFFPAVTGIMVGAGMSGVLRDPRRSIPVGTLAAWVFTTLVYLTGAVWYATVAEPDDLIRDRLVMVDRAWSGSLVLLGLLTATLMAALSSLVAAPRLLHAMAEQKVVPGSSWLSRTDAGGQPRNAVIVTTVVAGLGMLTGSLDAIAPVITAFFLLTYLTINVIVYVEQALGMISWRPSFRVPRTFSLLGAAMCLLALAVSSPTGGVLELSLVAGAYFMVASRQLETPWETVGSGAVVSLAAWAAHLAAPLGRSRRAWKPDLLVPVATIDQLECLVPYVSALAGQRGTLRIVALGGRPTLLEQGPARIAALRREGLEASWAVLRADHYMEAVGVTLDALQAALFPPNLVVVDERFVSNEEIAEYMHHCRELGVGLVLHVADPDDRPTGVSGVNVWLSDRAPDYELDLRVANLDLPVLVGWIASRAWKAPLRLHTVVRNPTNKQAAADFLDRLVDQARLTGAQTHVHDGAFMHHVHASPDADVHLFGMPPVVDKQRLREIKEAAGSVCMFLMDSGEESALA